MNTRRQVVETYVRAKDQNRPYLIESVFSASGTLEIVATAEMITFPPLSRGVQTISDILVRRFAQVYENVYTLCLALPPRDDAVHFTCPWLVGMSEKETGTLRIGFGRYNWLFQPQYPNLAERLSITIEVMERLPPDCLAPAMTWLSHLPYPWCSAAKALEHAPQIEGFDRIRKHLSHVSA